MTREEIEYRRYLERRIRRRKRRRQVMIARAVLLIVMLFALFGVFSLVRGLTGGHGSSKKSSKETPKMTEQTYEPKAENKQTPEVKKKKATAKPADDEADVPANVPKGYEKLYNSLVRLKGRYDGVEDILMNISKYPKELLNLAIKNHETIEFVAGYPKHDKDIEANGRISANELKKGIPLLQQWDTRWGYVKYGNSMIAVNGCGPTCLAMVYAGITKDTAMTPADIAEYCSNNNYYNDDTGTSWTLMTEGAKDFELSVKKVSLNAASIKAELKQKRPMICSMSRGDFTTQGHFIVIKGIDSKGKLLINDPNSIANSKKRWSIGRIIKQIKAAWSYSQE